MFSFPPEFPFVSARKADAKKQPAATVEPPPIAEMAPPEPRQEISPSATAAPTSPTALMAPAPASRAERRKIKRDPLAAIALLRIDGFHGPPARIELTDISISGARFRCNRPLEIGEKAQIRLEVGPLRWTTRLRIVHCTRIDNEQLSVGCAFLRTELLRPWPAAA